MLCENKAVKLAVPSHVTYFNQSEQLYSLGSPMLVEPHLNQQACRPPTYSLSTIRGSSQSQSLSDRSEVDVAAIKVIFE